jgi:hypothetical protein
VPAVRAWRAVAAIALLGGGAITAWLVSSGGGKPADSFSDVVSGRAEERQKMIEQQRRMEAEEEAAKRKHRLEALPQVFGARPGQPGPLLAGVHFDYDLAVPDDARARISDFDIATDGHVYIFANSFPGVTVDFGSDDGVVDAITRAWGPSPAGTVWVDEQDRVTASLFHDHGLASVSWQTFQTVDDLIKPSDPDRFGFEPTPLVGATQDDVRAIMHAGDYVADDKLIMTLPHLGGDVVDVTFELAHGTVAAIAITIQARQVRDDVLAALAKKYGAAAGPWHHAGLTINVTPDVYGDTIRVERARK